MHRDIIKHLQQTYGWSDYKAHSFYNNASQDLKDAFEHELLISKLN